MRGRAAGGAALVGGSVWCIGTFLGGAGGPPPGARGAFGVLRPPGALPEEALEDLIGQIEGLDMDAIRKEIAEEHDHDAAAS